MTIILEDLFRKKVDQFENRNIQFQDSKEKGEENSKLMKTSDKRTTRKLLFISNYLHYSLTLLGKNAKFSIK